MTGFGARLAEAKSRRGPLCLGIDPHPELLRAWDLPTDADGLAAFCDICIASSGVIDVGTHLFHCSFFSAARCARCVRS